MAQPVGATGGQPSVPDPKSRRFIDQLLAAKNQRPPVPAAPGMSPGGMSPSPGGMPAGAPMAPGLAGMQSAPMAPNPQALQMAKMGGPSYLDYMQQMRMNPSNTFY